jgi:hypothetical protein
VAVRLRAGGDVVAAAGGADSGRPGVPVLGGWSEPGPLDAEGLWAAAPAGDQRPVPAGAGVGARRGPGAAGARGRWIRRAGQPTLRGTGWRARRLCGASGRSGDAKSGAGSNRATRPTPTKRRGENRQGLEARGIEGYVPDSNWARELKGRRRRLRAGGLHHAEQRRMRQRLRSLSGRAVYQRRKAIIEPVFGVLKEQRGMRRFRLRGLAKVAVEMALATTAYNLTRRWSLRRAGAGG